MGLSFRPLQKIWDQVNFLDDNRTYKNPEGNAKGKGPGYKAPSAFHQVTHSGAANFIGDATVKPAGQFMMGAGNQIYNRAVAPVFQLPQVDVRNTALGGAAKFLNADGSLHQTVGGGIQTALNLASGGTYGAARSVVSKSAPKVIQRFAPGMITSGMVGAGFGAGSSISNNESPHDIIMNTLTGGAMGVAIPVAGAAAARASRPVVRAISNKASQAIESKVEPVFAHSDKPKAADKAKPTAKPAEQAKPKVAAKEQPTITTPAPVNEPAVNINGKDVTLSELKTQRAKLGSATQPTAKQKTAMTELDGHIKDLEELQALTGGKPTPAPIETPKPAVTVPRNETVMQRAVREAKGEAATSKPKVTLKQPKAPTDKQVVSQSKAQLKAPTTGTEATNQTYKRIIKDKDIPTGSRKAIKNLTHEVHNQKKMQSAAKTMVKTDRDTAQRLFDNESLVGSNPDAHIHLGNALNEHYNATGKLKQAGKVYDDMIATATRLGQGFNSLKAISKISVQGIVRHAEKIADSQGRKLAPELRDQLTKMAKDIAKMPDGAKKAQAIKNMLELAKQPTQTEKLWNVIKQVSSIPRTLMTSGDLSYALRQGAVLASTHPVIWAKSVAASAKMAASPKAFAREMNNVRNLKDINGESMQAAYKKAKLYLPGIMGKNEEVFADSRIFETAAARKAGIGHVVMASERSFTGAATMQRALTLKKIVDDLGGLQKMDDWTKKDWEDLGRVLETATGRGRGSKANPLGKWFEDAAPTFSQTIFSARLWKSRLDLLNPVYYARLSPVARKEAIKSSVAFAGVMGTVLAAAEAAGADVETDPRSTDFGKAKFGNTRYDILGGLQQNIVVAARELSGQQKNKDGTIIGLNEGGPYDPTRLGVLTNLVTNKLAPVPATGLHLLRGKGADFQPVNPWAEAAKLLIPLGVQDTASVAANSKGEGGFTVAGVAKAAATTAPSFFGVGVQNYDSGPKMVPGKTDVNNLTPKELTKYKTNVTREFKNGLSKDDQYLFELTTNKEAAQLAIRNNKVTQEQLDGMEAKFNRAKYKMGLPLNYVNGVKESELKQMSKSTQEVVIQASLMGKNAFTNSKDVHPAAKAAIDELMKTDAWPNVGDIKATNKLALDLVYAEKDLQNTAPDDQAAQYELIKKFWKRAVKEQYNDKIANLYDGNASDSYGFSIADIKRLASGITVNGQTYQMGKGEFDKMIELDNRLLEAGLIDQPKFSNKTRAAYGYGAAPTSKNEGLGYSGSKDGGGGRKKANPFADTERFRVKFSAERGKARVSTPSVAKPQIKAAYKARVNKPKVTMKKAR